LGVSESLKMTITSSAVMDPVGCPIIQSGFIWAWKRGLTGEGDDGAVPPEAIRGAGDLLLEETCLCDLRGDFLRHARAPSREDEDEVVMDVAECVRVHGGMDIGKGCNIGTAPETEGPSIPSVLESLTSGRPLAKTLGSAGSKEARNGSVSSRHCSTDRDLPFLAFLASFPLFFSSHSATSPGYVYSTITAGIHTQRTLSGSRRGLFPFPFFGLFPSSLPSSLSSFSSSIPHGAESPISTREPVIPALACCTNSEGRILSLYSRIWSVEAWRRSWWMDPMTPSVVSAILPHDHAKFLEGVFTTPSMVRFSFDDVLPAHQASPDPFPVLLGAAP